MKRAFLLEGLNCPYCAAAIEKEAAALPGVTGAQMNLVAQTLTLEGAGSGDVEEKLRRIVLKHEPDVRVMPKSEDGERRKKAGEKDAEAAKEKTKLAVAFALFILGLGAEHLFSWPKYAFVACYALSYLASGAEVLIGAARGMKRRASLFDEAFLMSVSTIGAWAIGEYPEAAAVMLFYGVGEFFQAAAVRKSRKSISALMDLRPDSARVVENGKESSVPPEGVAAGTLILVKPGERVPLDGEVEAGWSLLDTAALTGESLPREVEKGDSVPAGCIVKNGALTLRVTRPFGESTVSRILDMVENAAGKKARTEHFITAFARVYTPAVVVFALLMAVVPPLAFGGAFTLWLKRALVFLVVSCPCALVISVPLGFFGGIARASGRGVLVKGGNYLEALARVDTVVFDKTGTLTTGGFTVKETLPRPGVDGKELLLLAAAAERHSNHPIALALKNAAGETPPVLRHEELAGMGVRAVLKRGEVLAGGARLMARSGVKVPENDLDRDAVFVALDGRYIGAVVLEDALKPGAKAAVEALRRRGVSRVAMLTGDSRGKAEHTARMLDIDTVHSELMPDEKVGALEKLMEEGSGKTAFVGDGINDAPVLAAADVGIAMGALGSDAAIEAADVVLMTDDVGALAAAIDTARKTGAVVRQNIVFALSVKALVLVLGVLGLADMWLAVFADVGVSLLACLNSLRLLARGGEKANLHPVH